MLVPLKKPLKFSTYLLIALIGLTITALLSFIGNQDDHDSRHQQFVLQRTAEIQATENVNCTDLPIALKTFLNNKARPALMADRNTESTQKQLIGLRDEINEYRRSTNVCISLYLLGKSGRLNGLSRFTNIIKIGNDLAILRVYLSPGIINGCNQDCLDKHTTEALAYLNAIDIELDAINKSELPSTPPS
jgi:hypothetical protein